MRALVARRVGLVVGRVVGLVVVVIGLLALVTVPASAHVELVSSTPTDGSTVEALPAEVSFTFSGELAAPAYVVVTAPDGTALTTGDPAIDGATVTQSVDVAAAGDQRGSFLVAFRVNSVDGHQLTGQISFSVRQVDTPDASETASAVGSPTTTDTDPATSNQNTATSSSGGSDAWSMPGYRFWVGFGLFAGAGALWLASRRIG